MKNRILMNHLNNLIRLHQALLDNTTNRVTRGYHEGAIKMAESIRQFAQIDQAEWAELKDEEARADWELDQMQEERDGLK